MRLVVLMAYQGVAVNLYMPTTHGRMISILFSVDVEILHFIISRVSFF
jgi:hypothetical protein